MKRIRPHTLFRRLFAVLAVIGLVCLHTTLFVHAAPPLLVDEGDYLSPDEERVLLDRLNGVSERFNVDVALVTVSSLDGKDPQDYADDYFDYNGYGTGQDADGVLLLFSYDGEYVDMAYSTHGYAAWALTDAALDRIDDEVIPQMRAGKSSGDFTGAFEAYVDGVETYLEIAEDGEPYEHPGGGSADEPMHGLAAVKKHAGGGAVLSVLSGVAGSFAYMNGQKRKLRSVRRQRGAGHYMTGDGPVLAVKTDRFVNRSVNRVPIPKKEPSSGSRSGGGTTYHTSSSGRSHGGRSHRI